MVEDISFFQDIFKHLSGAKQGLLYTLILLIQRRLGGYFVFRTSSIPLGDPKLVEPVLKAQKMVKRGRIISYGTIQPLPDEVPLYHWQAVIPNVEAHRNTCTINGFSFTDNHAALTEVLDRAAAQHLFASGEERLATQAFSVGGNRTQAALKGTLDLIAQNALIMTYTDNLPAPKIDLQHIEAQDSIVRLLVERCVRYRLKPYTIRLVSDAPTYALLVILEDTTTHNPSLTFGVAASQSQARATEKALIKSMQKRVETRITNQKEKQENKMEQNKTQTISWFTENIPYEYLRRLTTTPLVRFTEPWELEADETHLSNLISWYRNKGFDLHSTFLDLDKERIGSFTEEVAIYKLGATEAHSNPHKINTYDDCKFYRSTT